MADETPSDDHNFVWWICMLPFIAAMAVFLYKWMHNQSENSYIGYAIGSLLVGIVFSAFIAASAGSAKEEKDTVASAGGNGSGGATAGEAKAKGNGGSP